MFQIGYQISLKIHENIKLCVCGATIAAVVILPFLLCGYQKAHAHSPTLAHNTNKNC